MNNKENECKVVENGQFDTAGSPIKVLVCYCGTTACRKNVSFSYPLPKDFPKKDSFIGMINDKEADEMKKANDDWRKRLDNDFGDRAFVREILNQYDLVGRRIINFEMWLGEKLRQAIKHGRTSLFKEK